ncbi:tRNA (32-2'-O)-methyltransferase regulator THADA isoform X2 [Brachyhypopomus gauderio]|uniref:tRNA (32-2'-O)-methyltransferase regulator THADA isoform X2 n=1 Tax=Brachyhypopomus gauderio TaxID=698409 RepID=UPI0040436247
MTAARSDVCPSEALLGSLDDGVPPRVKNTLVLFLKTLSGFSRSSVTRAKARALEDASRTLETLPVPLLRSLEQKHHRRLVQLLLGLQTEPGNTASACRKLDQMMQYLGQVDQSLVFEEVQHCLHQVLHQDQVFSIKDLQLVSVFLEESAAGRGVLRQNCSILLHKLSELLPVIMKEEATRNGSQCYQTVKVCLQVFQLLPEEVAQRVFEGECGDVPMRRILGFLMGVILGEISNRDTRLLAGSAVAMLISTATDRTSGSLCVWSLLQVTSRVQWSLTVGGLQVTCRPRGVDAVDRLSVVRGLLTCCRKDILTSRSSDTCLLLDGLFPLIPALCDENLDCHYYVFQVFNMWLRRVKECLPEIWEVIDTPLLGEHSSLQHTLAQIIWANAENPVEGVMESVSSAFCLFLEIYDLDCRHCGNAENGLYVDFVRRIAEMPSQSKGKYQLLCGLVPYTGTHTVLDQYPNLPSHILKCLSINHLAPCAAEIYKTLLQEQRRELTTGQAQEVPPTEHCLAAYWARRWQPTVLKALMSDVVLLQNNASSYLLPCTLHTFPAAPHVLLPALDSTQPGHLRAWTCIVAAQRITTGQAPWASHGVCPENLRRALSSLDDRVRLAALNLLCCSPKTREAPSQVEYSALRAFLPLNLNSESSTFRQHLQAGVRKFLVRIRDSCMASLKGQRAQTRLSEEERILQRGVDFVDWLAHLPLGCLAPGNSFQRKKTALLLLAAVLETCSNSWSPARKKGQPPANMDTLIKWATEREKWEFFSKSRQLVLIGCLEDTTNEIREQAAELLVRFFPQPLNPDITTVLFRRAHQLLHSPRVPDAQMGALMSKLLLQTCASLDGLVGGALTHGKAQSATLVRHLLETLKHHHLTAQEDMVLAARTTPLHGVVGALQRCLLEAPGVLSEALDHRGAVETIALLEKITQLLLGVLCGHLHTEDKEAPPSFCDMGNAISSLIGQPGLDEEGEENVLLSEEHSVVLTCCWVSLKEIGIFLGSLVERILSVTCMNTLLTVEDVQRASKVFKDIILKCRHWGAVEGCCIGFTKFCGALLASSNPEFKVIPGHILQQGLSVLRSPRGASVTRRGAGLPVLILSVLAAEECSTCRPLLAVSMDALLETARTPLPQDWDATFDLPQVCAVHTLQALVKGSSLGLSVLQYAPAVAMLSLTLLSSPCWAMRNAALQLYSSLCSRMLGQRPTDEDVSTQYGMSPPAFFHHYPGLRSFLQGALECAATDLQEARLTLHPALYPVLTLLAKLQPGHHEQTRTLSGFLPPLLQLAASPIYAVRLMSSRALVAMVPPPEYLASVLRLVRELPESPDQPCCHNSVHGRLLQMEAVLDRALRNDSVRLSSLRGVVEGLEARLWLASTAQRCPLVRRAYVAVVVLLRGHCSGPFLSCLGSLLLGDVCRVSHTLELGSASFQHTAVHFLCADPDWAWQVWQKLSSGSAVTRLSLVKWVKEGCGWRGTRLQQVVQREIQANLKEALLQHDVEYKESYLAALVEVMTPDGPGRSQPRPAQSGLEETELQECVELLLEDVEGGAGGPELLSQALCAVSLLLSHSADVVLLQRWCVLLETHRRPEAPEVLRLACAQALRLTAATVVSCSLRGCPAFKSLGNRLISTGVHLLQDESQEVRSNASVFASILSQSHVGEDPQNCFLMHISQSLHLLLDLLLEELWDSEGALQALLCHLPECNLSILLQEAKLTPSLYEQDEANVFLEPSVIAETVLPYLVCLAKHYPESSSLAECLDQWAQQNANSIQENLSICTRLQLGDALDADWLSVLMDPRFHGALCSLFARAAFFLQLLRVSDNLRPLFDPLTLAQDLLDSHKQLCFHGVFLSTSFIDSVKTICPGDNF